MAINTLLVANRGEIAVRIIRAAREMGIRTVQGYSSADSDSLAVRMADHAVEIGPPPAAKSYLDIAAILAAADAAGADAIHPGYGFLAENAAFADAVEAAGLVFVGPRADTIRLMGDKVAARSVAARAGVSTIPGSIGTVAGIEAAREIVTETGFPVMIKAAAGGGGRGIRVADNFEELEAMMPTASAEAMAAFGDGGLYVEKVIAPARHIEVQVLGDGREAVHLFERECSLQRRRQKVWEEAPAATIDAATRATLCASAVAVARSVDYRGAGTLEFLYDETSGAVHFIEMNTRIQVEHPVTELITGVDLVREMLHIAAGEPLRLRQDEIVMRGHAIQVRINAEDPANGFLPFPGKIGALDVPGGPGVRFDTFIYPGYAIPPFYDSLLGKLIVWGEDRDHALARLKGALGELAIGNIKTTKPLHVALADDAAVRNGNVHTRWLEDWLGSNAPRLV